MVLVNLTKVWLSGGSVEVTGVLLADRYLLFIIELESGILKSTSLASPVNIYYTLAHSKDDINGRGSSWRQAGCTDMIHGGTTMT